MTCFRRNVPERPKAVKPAWIMRNSDWETGPPEVQFLVISRSRFTMAFMMIRFLALLRPPLRPLVHCFLDRG